MTVSMGLAAVMTATPISYVGAHTFWCLVVGFKRLMDEADRAATLNELREAGERYAKVMGRYGRLSAQGWCIEAEDRFAVEAVMGQTDSKKKLGRFELRVSEDDLDVAYLRLPSHPGETCKMSKSIRLAELMGS